MKIVKNDYPWTVIAEEKTSKAGNPYIDIAIGFKEKNIKATCEAEKYTTKWGHTLDESVLLKGASILENVYQQIKAEREKERFEKKKLLNGIVKPDLPQTDPNAEFIDDSIPF
jgi:hypothetical protein